MPGRAFCVRRTICTTRYLTPTRGSPLEYLRRRLAVTTRLDFNRRKVPSAIGRIASFHSQPRRAKEDASSQSRSLWPKTPWLEDRLLAHPRFTQNEDALDNVRIGMTWFSGDGSDFVSLPLPYDEGSLKKGCPA